MSKLTAAMTAQADQERALAEDLVTSLVRRMSAVINSEEPAEAPVAALCERVYALDDENLRGVAIYALIEWAGWQYQCSRAEAEEEA